MPFYLDSENLKEEEKKTFVPSLVPLIIVCLNGAI